MNEQYTTQIAALKKEIRELESQLTKCEAKLDIRKEFDNLRIQAIQELQQSNEWLEKRNKQLENPKGSHYDSLTWPGKIVFCIRKLRRPLRLQEIQQELKIMDAKTGAMEYHSDHTLSSILSKTVAAGKLHIEKVRGTRGAYYALPEWLNEEGKLPEKLRRNMW